MPLGGNVVRKDLGDEICEKITEDVKNSIIWSIENPESSLEFAKKWGRGIDDKTNKDFVEMYVNKRTIDYEEEGREAIREFLRQGKEIGLVRYDLDIEKIEFIGSGE